MGGRGEEKVFRRGSCCQRSDGVLTRSKKRESDGDKLCALGCTVPLLTQRRSALKPRRSIEGRETYSCVGDCRHLTHLTFSRGWESSRSRSPIFLLSSFWCSLGSILAGCDCN